ncbi:MAG: DNA-binding protein [Tistrella sp.]|uniref:DNA-binding protein n=1 Tax=Tistrella mobilis TaxID=171437 RepID=A0A3B9IJ50_9PROT|nr:Zn-ribbon domain-containing OB-fold protein [Tistrella sp.]MAD35189.1 DNA-binding protein [Tistrella sp.]MBA76954.1 DNA-binding protein [Tistrella sp.]HAE47736.1 DNA-binding protein [Tistrella mobilis]
MSLADRPLPKPMPETRHYWEGAREGRLVLQSCQACTTAYFPPRPFCPHCGSREVKTFDASGRGRLYSFIINHLPAPGYDGPFIVAAVELEEGPRMMTNIVDCPADPAALTIDMPLEVTFERRTDEITVPQFRPVRGDAR